MTVQNTNTKAIITEAQIGCYESANKNKGGRNSCNQANLTVLFLRRSDDCRSKIPYSYGKMRNAQFLRPITEGHADGQLVRFQSIRKSDRSVETKIEIMEIYSK